MKKILIGFVFICSSCATYPTGPDISVSAGRLLTPVSLSSVVSANGKKEKNEIRKISGYVSGEQHATEGFDYKSTRYSYQNDIEKTIVSATGGDEHKAVKNVRIIIIINSHPAKTEGINSGAIEGNLIQVK